MVIGIFFSSCLEKTNPDQLKNTKWELTEQPGVNLPIDSKATLNITEDFRISGKSFCNNYGGQVQIKDHVISLKNVFGTKMYCQNYDVAERDYLNALHQANHVKIVDGKLQLLNDKTILLVFSKLN